MIRVFLAVVLFGFVAGPAEAADRPNVVFIFTDDHASHAIGAYGGWLKDVAPTPNLDQLASQGALFKNAFCTNSLCGPSRAVILTGKHSHLNGFRQNGDRFDGSQQTFPKLLQQAGYRTALFGKWHLASDPTGFDAWEVLPGQGHYYNPDFRTPGGQHRRDGYVTDLITEMSVEWLRQQRDSGEPFFLMCQHKAPHREWKPALRHLALFDDQDLPEPDTLFDDYHDNASPARHQTMTIAEHMNSGYDLKLPAREIVLSGDPARLDKLKSLRRMTPQQRAAWNAAYQPKNEAYWRANLSGKEDIRWKYQRYLKDYLRCIKAVDESVGTIRQTLEELGLAENTIVIYSSDQGFFLGDHGWYDKRWMYEESLRMPLIVHWPGVTEAGSRINAMTQNLDYAETFLDMAGVEIPGDMQGRSLQPLLQGETPSDWRNSLYYHFFEYPAVHMVARHYGVRTERYKLMHFYEFDEWEFYDLQTDPDELENQYSNPAYADQIDRLKEEVMRLREQYQDDTDIGPKPLEWQRKVRSGDAKSE